MSPIAGRSLDNARSDLDRRWALLFDTSPAVLRTPGTHYVATTNPESRAWLGYAVYFGSLQFLGDAEIIVVSTTDEACQRARSRLDAANDADARAAALLEMAQTLGCEDTYPCDVLVGAASTLRLRDLDGVIECPNDPSTVDWNGKPLSNEVDGPIFATSDEDGLTAWAGIKRCSPWAQDFQVDTRPDKRGQGLGRQVSSAATARLLDEGITPYYAHLSDNAPSAALARSMGFIPYAKAVLAETRLPFAG